MVNALSPLLAEPVSVEFANTVRRRRGEVIDGLDSCEAARIWFQQMAARLGEPPSTFESDRSVQDAWRREAVELRDAVRRLLTDADAQRSLNVEAVDLVNKMSRRAPMWPRLDLTPAGARVEIETSDRVPVPTRVLGSIARDAMSVLTGPERHSIHACTAPGCLLFYVQTHRGRTWCSTRCGNRVRSARRYERLRTAKHDAGMAARDR